MVTRKADPAVPAISKPEASLLRFGEFEFDQVRGRLTKAGVPLKLVGQPRDVLIFLLEQPGAIVTRQELQQRLWGTEVVVEFDASINTAIKKIRQVLEDDAADPRFLETVPRHGYRFIHPVEVVHPQVSAEEAVPAAKIESAREHVLSRKRAIVLSAGAVFVGAIALSLGPLGFFKHPETPLLVEPLTSLPNDSYRAALSPDGSRVVFCWGGYEDGAAVTLWIKQVDGSAFHPLTTKGRDEYPAWSPDGKWIAFVRSLKDVMIMPSLGGPERKIAETQAEYVSWLPDSEAVVVGTLRPGTPDTFDYSAISVETGARTQLTSAEDEVFGYQPFSVSPDGGKVGFTRRLAPGEEPELCVRPLAGGRATRLSPPGWRVDGWTWTPDSTEVIFASSPAGVGAIWRVSVDGGTPREIQLNGARNICCPFMVPVSASRSTPQGQLLGFESWDRRINVHQLTLEQDGTAPPRVSGPPVALFPSSAEEHSLVLSPDGRHSAFVSTRSGFSELWLGNTDTTNAVPLTSLGKHDGFPYSPAWSNDGARIAFQADHGLFMPSASKIIVHNVSGVADTEIASIGLNVRPSWSADDQWVYFGSRRSGSWQVWRHSTGSRSPAATAAGSDGSIQVTSEGGFEGFESPEGKYFFYKKDQNDEDLWMMPVGDQGPVESRAVRIIKGGIFAGWWGIAGNGIYYADITKSFKGLYPSSEPKPIYYFDLRTSQRTQLGAIDHRVLFFRPDFAVSRDGRKLTYSQIDFHGIDLDMVRGFR